MELSSYLYTSELDAFQDANVAGKIVRFYLLLLIRYQMNSLSQLKLVLTYKNIPFSTFNIFLCTIKNLIQNVGFQIIELISKKKNFEENLDVPSLNLKIILI